MPIYRIDDNNIVPVAATTFAQQGLREREDLQALLELITAVIAPGETGEVAPGVIGAELAIGPGTKLRVRLETLCLITVPCEPPCEESDVGDKNPCLCGASVFPVNPKSEAEAGLPVFHPAAFTDFSTGMTIIRRSLREQTAPTRGPRAQAHWRG